jgi:hypothetical protein
MQRGLQIVFATCLLAVATRLYANILIEFSYEEKTKLSDLVVIGKVTSNDLPAVDAFGPQVKVKVLTTLKGPATSDIIVLSTSRIPESDPRCCKTGSTYMMFLRHTRTGEHLISVNGRYGILKIG